MKMPGYVDEFVATALRQGLGPETSIALANLIENRNAYMTITAIARLIGCSVRHLQRKIASNPHMQASGRGPFGSSHAILYPFWLIHEFYYDDKNDDEDPDEDDEETEEDPGRDQGADERLARGRLIRPGTCAEDPRSRDQGCRR